jgi:alpha-maltose-1-phosphate synthase
LAGKVLHILTQHPGITGSGITLDALVRHADDAGWEQRAIVGSSTPGEIPAVGSLSDYQIRPLYFGDNVLDFQVPGMSDVMPYRSSRFSALSQSQLERYKSAWSSHITQLLSEWRPDLIHMHHVWIVASMIKDLAPDIPVVNHCHSTGIRQMSLCPHLAFDVCEGCRRNDRFVTLHREHETDLRRILKLEADRVSFVGAGYRDDLFNYPEDDVDRTGKLLYVGKLSHAKGLPSLLDAVERLAAIMPGLQLHVVGDGTGAQADELRARMNAMEDLVVQHGQLAQADLAIRMRECAVCVLPSFYEGLPLILIEALACGCRLVSTRLPGVVDQLVPRCGDLLETVPVPRLLDIDTPAPDDLPAFVDNLVEAVARALSKLPIAPDDPQLEAARTPFSWRQVFSRVEAVWESLLVD